MPKWWCQGQLTFLGTEPNTFHLPVVIFTKRLGTAAMHMFFARCSWTCSNSSCVPSCQAACLSSWTRGTYSDDAEHCSGGRRWHCWREKNKLTTWSRGFLCVGCSSLTRSATANFHISFLMEPNSDMSISAGNKCSWATSVRSLEYFLRTSVFRRGVLYHTQLCIFATRRFQVSVIDACQPSETSF